MVYMLEINNKKNTNKNNIKVKDHTTRTQINLYSSL